MAKIIGTSGNDMIVATRTDNWVESNQGNDTITFHEDGGTVFGGRGDDTFYLSPPGTAQVHAYGGLGDDTMYIDTSSRVAPYGVHAWGGEGRDKFIFTNLSSSTAKMTGRIDDFDPSRDEIWVDDKKVDFENLPSNVRLLEHNGQPWIMIDNRVLYALEGARTVHNSPTETSEEVHFLDWPSEWANGVPASANMSYQDFVTFFPANQMTIAEDKLNHVRGTSKGEELHGTVNNDYIHGADGYDSLYGGAGHDVIDGEEGNDHIYGGAGNDSLSGGLDQDVIYAGAGDDIAYGGSGHDIVYGEDGNDTIGGNAGHDLLFGGAGNDSISGGTGNDVLVGGKGNDTLEGGKGNDLLIADGSNSPSAGSNELYGGEGNDTLVGASGQTTEMTGGEGADTFVAAEDGEIVIKDFDRDTDRLDVRGHFSDDDDLADFMETVDRDGGVSDLRLNLPTGGSVLLEGAGDMTPAELESFVLRDGPPMDVNAAIADQEELIAADPDLFGAHEHRGEATQPPEPPPEAASHGGGGCFVATASFGDIAHPDVTWLRQFRDTKLVYTPAGRAFIRFYWTVGPVMARYVHADRISGRISRWLLSGLVKGLKRLV